MLNGAGICTYKTGCFWRGKCWCADSSTMVPWFAYGYYQDITWMMEVSVSHGHPWTQDDPGKPRGWPKIWPGQFIKRWIKKWDADSPRGAMKNWDLKGILNLVTYVSILEAIKQLKNWIFDQQHYYKWRFYPTKVEISIHEISWNRNIIIYVYIYIYTQYVIIPAQKDRGFLRTKPALIGEKLTHPSTSTWQ